MNIRKEIRILGMSIPISVIILILVTGAAIAGFLWQGNIESQLQARQGVSATISSLECNEKNNSGAYTDCTLVDASSITSAWNDIDNTSVLQHIFTVTADNDATMHFTDPSSSIDGVGSIICETKVGTTPCEGYALTAGIGVEMEIVIYPTDLTSGQTVAPFNIPFEIED